MPSATGVPDHLDDVGIAAFLLANDFGGDRGDGDRRIGKRQQRRANRLGRDRRDIALEIDDDLRLLPDQVESLVDARGAVDVMGAGHHGFAADGSDRRGNRVIVGGHHDTADVRLDRAAPDMDDHRLAADVGERFARQTRRGHAGGDQNQRFGHRLGWQKASHSCAYTGCGAARKACSFRPANRGQRNGNGFL